MNSKNIKHQNYKINFKQISLPACDGRCVQDLSTKFTVTC